MCTKIKCKISYYYYIDDVNLAGESMHMAYFFTENVLAAII